MNALDYLYEAFSSHYATRISPISLECNEHTCDECLRSIAETSHPNEHVFIQKNSYGLSRTRCLSCQMLYVGNDGLLGGFIKMKSVVYVSRDDESETLDIIKSSKGKKEIDIRLKAANIKTYTEKQYTDSQSCAEVYIAQGSKVYIKSSAVVKTMKMIKTQSPSAVKKWLKENDLLLTVGEFKKICKDNPIAECQTGGVWEEKKMNSMAGLGIVIHNSGVEFYAPGEHFQKLNKVEGFPYKVHPYGGGLIFKDVVNRFRDIRPLLVIETFGSCKEDFIHNIEMTLHENEIIVCRDKDVVKVDLIAYDGLIDLLKNEDNKTIKEFLSSLYRYYTGSLKPMDFITQSEHIQGFADAISKLPSDPHEIINLKNVVEKELIQ